MTRAAAPDGGTARWRARLRRAAPLIALALAATAVAIVIAEPRESGLPLDPAATDATGTRALVEVLRGLDRRVDVVDPDDVAGGDAPVVLLLWDQLDDAERAALERRVEAGARLVVTDPESPLAPQVAGGLPPLERRVARSCDVAALRDARWVRPAGGALYEAPDGAQRCFAIGDAPWLVVETRGRGHVIATGSAGFLTNSWLDRADNAVLAVHLLTPTGTDRTEIVRPAIRATDGAVALGDLVPDRVRAGLWQVLIGFLVLIAWRARRLGAPLIDRAPVRLASSDLTAAVGALLAHHDTRAAALERIAADTRRRLARRLDLPEAVEVDLLVDHLAARTSLDPVTLHRVLRPAPPDRDADLLQATTALAELEQNVRTRMAPTPEEPDDH